MPGRGCGPSRSSGANVHAGAIYETGGAGQYTAGSSSVAQSGDDSLPVFRQEFHRRHLWESTILAEEQWVHDGRKLISATWLISK
jgi:hypothetical protein